MSAKDSSLIEFLPEMMVGGIDYSLITFREANFFKIYGKLREEFSKKYPNPNPVDEEDTFVDSLAKHDPKADLFREALFQVKDVFDKIDKLKLLASDYEICCARLYCKYVINRMVKMDNPKRQEEITQFVSAFTYADIYEIVEAYFKIMKKYSLQAHEEPYYFLSAEQKRKVIYTGEMLKRATILDDNEIRISILEELTSTKS